LLTDALHISKLSPFPNWGSQCPSGLGGRFCEQSLHLFAELCQANIEPQGYRASAFRLRKAERHKLDPLRTLAKHSAPIREALIVEGKNGSTQWLGQLFDQLFARLQLNLTHYDFLSGR
jgi:hypothetical protein